MRLGEIRGKNKKELIAIVQPIHDLILSNEFFGITALQKRTQQLIASHFTAAHFIKNIGPKLHAYICGSKLAFNFPTYLELRQQTELLTKLHTQAIFICIMNKTCPLVTVTTMKRFNKCKPETKIAVNDLLNYCILWSSTLRENQAKNNFKCEKKNSALEFYTLLYDELRSRKAALVQSITSPQLLQQRVEEAIVPEACLRNFLP